MQMILQGNLVEGGTNEYSFAAKIGSDLASDLRSWVAIEVVAGSYLLPEWIKAISL